MTRRPPRSTLFPYTTLFRSETPGQQLGVAFNPASAEKLFANSGHTFAEIAELGKDREGVAGIRSEEHTSELQSLTNLVCRLLLEKKKVENSESSSYRSAQAN